MLDCASVAWSDQSSQQYPHLSASKFLIDTDALTHEILLVF